MGSIHAILNAELPVLIDYVNHSHEREGHGDGLHGREAVLEVEQRGKEHEELQEHEERHEGGSGEQQLKQLFHGG